MTGGLFGIDHHGFDLDTRTVSALRLFEDKAAVQLGHHDPSWRRPLGRRQGFKRTIAELCVPFVSNRMAIVRQEAVEFCSADVETRLPTERFGNARRQFHAHRQQERQGVWQPTTLIQFWIGQAALVFTTEPVLNPKHQDTYGAPGMPP